MAARPLQISKTLVADGCPGSGVPTDRSGRHLAFEIPSSGNSAMGTQATTGLTPGTRRSSSTWPRQIGLLRSRSWRFRFKCSGSGSANPGWARMRCSMAVDTLSRQVASWMHMAVSWYRRTMNVRGAGSGIRQGPHRRDPVCRLAILLPDGDFRGCPSDRYHGATARLRVGTQGLTARPVGWFCLD